MCNDHSNVLVKLSVSKVVSIDGCIATLVAALNAAGLGTVASCCGHGHRPGNIVLEDGREIIIARNYEEGRQIDKLFPVTSYGEMKGASEMTFVREAVPVVDRLKASLAVGEAIHPDDARDAVEALEARFDNFEVKAPGRDEWIDLGQAAIAGYVRDRSR